MKIIDLDSTQINQNEKTIIALGNFDGLHKGHQFLIQNMLYFAKKNNLKSSVLLFKNHSKNTLEPNGISSVLTTLEDKIFLLEKLDLDIVFIKRFDTEFSHMAPSDFLFYLQNFTYCKGIVVGKDYKFGYKGKGNTEYLMEKSRSLDIILNEIEDYILDGEIIKSTLIRKALKSGDVSKVGYYLGRYYSIKGKIIHGENRGHLLGFPTANIKNLTHTLPRDGVYYTISKVKDRYYPSMTAVGENKTFLETERKIETYISGFSNSIYGEVLEIFFVEFMRENVKFSTPEELIVQLEKDKKYIENKDVQDIKNMII